MTIPGKTCRSCGDPIPWRPGIPERASAKYCSEACRIAHARAAAAKLCLQCGEPLPWRPGAAIRERAKFCGNPCKFAYQAKNPARARADRITQPCATCGKPVEFLASQRGAASKNRSVNVYCDRKCKGLNHSKLMTGRRPSGGVYTSAATFRVIARTQFLDRCAWCGWAETSNDVAHIIDRRHGGADTVENVIMLCPNHHRKFDDGNLSEAAVRAALGGCLPGKLICVQVI